MNPPSIQNQTALDRSGMAFSTWPEANFFRRLSRRRPATTSPVAANASGVQRTRRSGNGDTFFDLRPYQPGDDVRHIDWSLYARLGRPLVRQFQAEINLPAWVVLDASGSMGVGSPRKWDLAFRLATALLFASHTRTQTRVWIGRDDLAPVHDTAGTAPPERAEALARLTPSGKTQLAHVARQLAERMQRATAAPARVVWISDFLDASGVEDACRSLRSGPLQPLFVHLEAPIDAAPEQVLLGEDCVRVEDAETGRQADVRLTTATLAAYHRQRQSYNEALARVCQTRGIRLLRMRSNEPFVGACLRLLRYLGL